MASGEVEGGGVGPLGRRKSKTFDLSLGVLGLFGHEHTLSYQYTT